MSQSFKRGYMFRSSCNFCETSANRIKTLGGLKYSRTVRITQASNHVCSRNILLLSLFPFREDERLIFHILYLRDGAFPSKTTTTAKSKQRNRLASNSMNRVKYVDDTTVIEFVPRLLPQTWILLFQISTLVNFAVSDIYSRTWSRILHNTFVKCETCGVGESKLATNFMGKP